MRPLRLFALWLLPATGLFGQGPAPGDDPQNPRAELDALAVELEGAVGRVSQPGVEPLLGADAARGYYLPGQGAFFVLPPRALPRESRQIIVRRGGTTPGSAAVAPGSSAELRELEELLGPEEARRIVQEQQLEAQARQELARRARERRQLSPEREAELRRLEKQVEAFQREAERARQEAERTWAEMLLEVQQRLQGTHAAAGATGPGGAAPAGSALPPPPPWRFWFGTEDPEDARTPQQVMDDVRAAIVSALEAHGARLRNVAGPEQVSVAVDFLPRGLFATSQRPVHTLVVRVRKQWLEERQDGRLASDELRRRVEISGY